MRNKNSLPFIVDVKVIYIGSKVLKGRCGKIELQNDQKFLRPEPAKADLFTAVIWLRFFRRKQVTARSTSAFKDYLDYCFDVIEWKTDAK